MATNPFAGKWTYRSLRNDPNINADFDQLEFGRGTLEIQEAAPAILSGTIGGPGWSLALHGAFGFGSPMATLRSNALQLSDQSSAPSPTAMEREESRRPVSSRRFMPCLPDKRRALKMFLRFPLTVSNPNPK